MNAIQKAKLLMVKGLIQFLNENTEIVSIVGAFQTALTVLKAKVAEIDETIEQVSASLSGITTDKLNLKQALSQFSADTAGMIYAFASANANNTLKQEVNFSAAKLLKKRDADLAALCQVIHDRGTEYVDSLNDYGINTELLRSLQSAINSFKDAVPKPRTAIGKRKTRKEILVQLFRELDEILNDRMDALMGKFRTTHPEFYRTYFNLREIKDTSTTATQLKGVITDSSTGAPVKGATIEVVELARTAKTGSTGEYFFKPIQFGKFTVKITAEGYQPFENDEIEIKMGDIRHLDVRLLVKQQ
jgi:hypothetical protein